MIDAEILLAWIIATLLQEQLCDIIYHQRLRVETEQLGRTQQTETWYGRDVFRNDIAQEVNPQTRRGTTKYTVVVILSTNERKNESSKSNDVIQNF